MKYNYISMSIPTKETTPAEVFMKSWFIYQEIIEHNYMYHQEITRSVKTWLELFKLKQSLQILDLGCGDASMALPLLSAAHTEIYIGCDLSKPALDIAHQKLKAAKIPFKCICDNMLQVASDQPDQSANLILSSYALHHLDAQQKDQIIRDISRILSPGGCFLLIDIFREPSEDRLTYMHNYMSDIRGRWLKLAPESRDLVVNHATAYDFPEHPTFYQTHCRKHQLSAGKRLDKYSWHEAWIFIKPSIEQN